MKNIEELRAAYVAACKKSADALIAKHEAEQEVTRRSEEMAAAQDEVLAAHAELRQAEWIAAEQAALQPRAVKAETPAT